MASPPGSNPPAPNRRFYSNGRGIWYIDRIWPLAAGLPEFDYEVESFPDLDHVGWFSDVWGKRPTYRAVIDHCKRILEADLKYPIVFAPIGPPHDGCLLDGVHRLAKAMLHGQKTVRAVRLQTMPEPDELVSPDDPRYESRM